MRAFGLLLLVSLNTFAASPIIFGARAGVPLTDNLNNITSNVGLNSPNKSYVVGPTLGLRLPLGFSVEGDALFTRQSLNFGQIASFGGLNTHSDSWEFPVMAKFHAGHGVIAPVIGAGVTVRHINNFGDVPSFLFNGSTNANTVGFVAGGGLRFQVGPLGVTPEIRYTRWNSPNFTQSLIDTFTGNQNQAQVLIGFTF